MTRLTLVLLSLATMLLLCGGCFPHLLPSGPVVPDEEAYLGPLKPSGIDYSGLTRIREAPVLPFLTWGLDFAEEMLFEFGRHPVYGMVEVTRVVARDGRSEWFALVSERSGVQHVVVGSTEAAALARSFPAPVWEGDLEVTEVRSARHVQYRARFGLPNGESVDALITSKSQGAALPKRNGNAMNHSEQAVLAVLDLEEFNWARAEVRVDGRPAPVRWLAPFVPFAWRLEQAAGGLATGSLWMPGGGGPGLLAQREAQDQDLLYEATRAGDHLLLTHRGQLLETTWTFEQPRGTDGSTGGNDGPTDLLDGPLELRQVDVEHGAVSVFRLRLNPALPDLRYVPERGFEARMVAGSNGAQGYMNGVLRIGSEGGDVLLDVLPEAPPWACERPVRNRLSFVRPGLDPGGPAGVRLTASIEPALAAGGAGPAACW
jgi:hypothetical protein